MSRYIDADEALEQIRKKLGVKSLDYLLEAERQIVAVIQSVPSIDIVFCKECKHNPWNIETDYTCVWDDDFADRPQTPDDFCSYGEREGE